MGGERRFSYLCTVLVYELSTESTQIGDECPICFEEFEQGKIYI